MAYSYSPFVNAPGYRPAPAQYNKAASQGYVAGPVSPKSPFFAADQSRRAAAAPSVLGATYSSPSNNQSQAPSFDPAEAARTAAQEAYNAENQALNTQFDYARAQLEGQLGGLGNQRDQSLAQVELGLGDINRQVGVSKTNLQTNTQQQINQAGSTARNVQGQNRNVLRALGILNSSAAGQILAKPLNQFDEQRAQLGQFLVQKTTELDDFVNQQVAQAAQIKNQIAQQYSDLVSKIQTDLRFNDRQRNDALKAANAALSQRMAEIAQSVQNYQQQAQLQKQQYQASLNQALNYQDPQANLGQINNQRLVNPGQGIQTALINPFDQKKKQDPINKYFQPNTVGGFSLGNI